MSPNYGGFLIDFIYKVFSLFLYKKTEKLIYFLEFTPKPSKPVKSKCRPNDLSSDESCK